MSILTPPHGEPARGHPVLMALLLMRFPGHDQVAAALFILFSFTDTLDGELARRSGTVSDFGKFPRSTRRQASLCFRC
jgi:hypothetical protein